jgi:Fe2+ or Zn2+ uptake regulation protein
MGVTSCQPLGVDRAGQILQRLRAEGSRITVARRALVEALVTAADHVTADDLAARVQAAHPAVHRSTIYRTLEALEHAGIVEHVHLGHGRAVYHLTDDRHLHLVCDACGAVVEVPEATISDLVNRIRDHHDFTIDSRHFALPGLCSACSAGSA